ncbi:MAG: DUF1292 domain-containing protein [Anaerococcus sp.]|nr:DUF1292 domain-containing protein [Peptoniphilaceae bacterium]MDY3054852.1 DUF1292 domain-containing protein [Anaerococcus sp.]
MDKIILHDENNNEVEFKLVSTFGVDDNDYAALEPLDEDFIVIFEMIKSNDEIIFKSIDDQEELNEVADVYEQMEREQNGCRTTKKDIREE